MDREVESLMRSLVNRLVAERAKNPDVYSDARERLVTAQAAWVQVRDFDCGGRYRLTESVSNRVPVYVQCRRVHAEQRQKQLQEWISQ